MKNLSRAPLKGWLLALPTNSRIGWKGLPAPNIATLILKMIHSCTHALVHKHTHTHNTQTYIYIVDTLSVGEMSVDEMTVHNKSTGKIMWVIISLENVL